MVSLRSLHANFSSADGSAQQFQCSEDLNLYDSPACDRLATQAAAGRSLQIVSLPAVNSSNLETAAVAVRLCEDDYPGWIPASQLECLTVAETLYHPGTVSAAETEAAIPGAIAFAQAAMTQPNEYLWGGTLGPNYDCSGLVQAAFASVGIWLPRDAYQQEAFTQAIALAETQLGDLIFFGSPQKATHVGLYLGDARYIHSSGKDQGHNGIAIDLLSGEGSPVSQRYYAQLRGAGRIVSAYCPPGTL